jgi:hypothetical protein
MIKIVTTNHRARALKKALADRIDPKFVEDLALASDLIREGAYERIEPGYRKRLRAAVDERIAQLATE